MSPPKVEIDSPNIVLRGRFNTSIFQPTWLDKHGLLRPEEAEKSEIEVVSPVVTSFRAGSFHLQVTQDRFSATALDAANVGALRDLVLGIFRLLEHTPLESLGINRNLHFKMGSTIEWHQLGHRLVPKAPWGSFLKDPGTLSVAVRGTLDSRPQAVVNVKVEPSARVPDGVYVSINEHYQESGDGAAGRLLHTLEAVWEDAQRDARKMAEGILTAAMGAQS